jgi:ABC-type transporter MlaC component
MGQRLSVLIALLSAGVLFSCQKGPAPQAGEQVDNPAPVLALSGPTTDPHGPIAIVKSSVSRALSTVQSPAGLTDGDDRRAEIQHVAQDLFDFNAMARWALGQHWQALSPQERNEFVQLFTDVLKQFFVVILERYSGERVAFLEEEVAGGYARVHSRIISTRASDLLKPFPRERWAAGLVLGAALSGRRR